MGNYTLVSDGQCVCPVGCKTCDEVNFKCLECNSGYYFNAGTCVKCIEPCATCSASGCLSCLGVYNLTGSVCSCPNSCSYCDLKTWTCSLCKDGYYRNAGNCLACLYPCSSCTASNTCTSCIVPFVLNSLNQCICPSNCLQCDSTGCIKCLDGFFKSGGICIQCTSPCKNCFGTAANCTSCLGQYALSFALTNGVNLGSCNCQACCNCDLNTFLCATAKDGYFLNNMGCSPCSQPCATCRDSSLICTKCMGSLVLTGTQCNLPPGCIKFDSVLWKCTMCNDGYLLNTDNTCTTCTAPCKTCISSYTQCTSCMGTYYLENYLCKCPLNCAVCGTNPYVCNTCNAGWVAISGICQKCIAPCSTCTNYQTNCQGCVGTYVLGNGQCSCPVNCKICDTINYMCTTCIDSFYQSAGTCYPCASQCKTCSGSALACTSCYGTYSLSSGNCLCPSNCKTCDTVKYVCSACNDGFVLTNGICTPCTSPCLNCIGTPTSCTSCKGKFALTGSSCFCPSYCTTCDSGPGYLCSKCNDGFSLTSIGDCQACAPICKKCSSSTTVCTECYGSFVISGTTCVCPTNCATCDSVTSKCLACKDGSYYTNGNCLLCSASCKTCSTSDLTCTSCKGVFDLIANQCVCPIYCASCDINGVCTKCNDGWIMINSVCTKCLAPCKTCDISTNNCKSCLGAHYYSIVNNVGTCTCPKSCIICDQYSWLCTKCASEFYYKDGNCYPCIFPCKTCTSDTICSSCINTLELDITTGKCNCPSNCAKCDTISLVCTLCKDGFFMNSGVCYPCEASCKTCVTNALTCTTCFRDYELNAKSQCCAVGCANCFLGATKCSECADKFYYSNGNCLPCLDPCVSCTTPGFCTKCNGIFVVDTARGTCSCPLPCTKCDSTGKCTECQSGYYASAGKCETCLSPCKTCSSRDICLTCIDYRGLNAYGCCSACPDRCITCDNILNTCSSCVSPAILTNGKC
ncbi:hypothetical protein SteCoe_20479 [Stentor coeruleus]|uniref:EGF-like domain-containing protein n=1 Tax=Stentor coeruleus TaxID=5963 RepID=A0A1R2BRZ8_9CILI|nr:hypothetical protein SteCoe_20479 [Stentor coeruleus]